MSISDSLNTVTHNLFNCSELLCFAAGTKNWGTLLNSKKSLLVLRLFFHFEIQHIYNKISTMTLRSLSVLFNCILGRRGLFTSSCLFGFIIISIQLYNFIIGCNFLYHVYVTEACLVRTTLIRNNTLLCMVRDLITIKS